MGHGERGREMNEWYTFSSLMSKYLIRIPIIQRDYVQGRASEYGVRASFLREIRDHLVNPSPMSLDFIYGKDANEGGKNVFIPLDGQQRLTTLLLLSWYFDQHKSKTQSDSDGWIFQYASRRMAMSFVEMLLSEHAYDRVSMPSDWVKGRKWFVPAWGKDPTVASMLRMLDDIHRIFRGEFDGIEPASVKLDCIKFYLHPCTDISEDETYLKINARGEPLTEWENIKSILDARAKRLLEAQNKKYKDAAEKWQKKINGEWTGWVETFLLKNEGLSKVHEDLLENYIALSVSVISAAFRNVIDAAGMLSVSSVKLNEKYGAKKEACVEVGEIMLGSRPEAKSIRGIDDLVKYYVGVFKRHEAIYEDYRDEYVFTDDAFVRAVEFLDALNPKQSGFVISGWSWDRSKNGLWLSLLKNKGDYSCDSVRFLKDFLFAGVRLSAKSFEQGGQGDFEKWCDNQNEIIFSRTDYTYHSVLRFALLVGADGDKAFAATRALNILDFIDTDEVKAETILDYFAILSQIEESSGQDLSRLMTELKEIHKNDEAWRNFISNEETKIAHWESDDIEFLGIETQLTELAGLCWFAYDKVNDRFDAKLVEFFLPRFMNNDTPVDDKGFVELIPYLPKCPEKLKLPGVALEGFARYHAWKRFLLQEPVRASIFQYLVDCERGEANMDSKPYEWHTNYSSFITHVGWPYAMVSVWNDGKVYAYNKKKMTNNCYQLSYDSNYAIEFLRAVAKSGNPFLRHGQMWLPLVGAKERTEVSVEVLSKLESGVFKYRVFDEEGQPIEHDYGKPYKSFKELLDCIESLRAGE